MMAIVEMLVCGMNMKIVYVIYKRNEKPIRAKLERSAQTYDGDVNGE